ncbi:hypothetical protein [Spirosoma sp. KUDC1026]|uniref:hypothetical protein n=1 Tax=Spirosoma sp. KUDC1026 TaxID=2745947 RepID=UPI00159B9E8E|nr:hypothetical protein [Spirosoma sp. KUDC1026]QKZ13686.1 hypothetical protein HU175_14010 [Spirosoma sp. KUDC1026]
MIVELYTAPDSSPSAPVDLPISNTAGELPEQEPTLDPGNLLGSFDSRDEAINFVQNQAAAQQQEVADTQSAPFNAYTHVEWLTVTLKNADQSTQTTNYYLVTDEGY